MARAKKRAKKKTYYGLGDLRGTLVRAGADPAAVDRKLAEQLRDCCPACCLTLQPGCSMSMGKRSNGHSAKHVIHAGCHGRDGWLAMELSGTQLARILRLGLNHQANANGDNPGRVLFRRPVHWEVH